MGRGLKQEPGNHLINLIDLDASPPQFEDASFEDLQGADARKAMLIIAVMAAHAFGEGSGVGVSFSGQRGWAQVRGL